MVIHINVIRAMITSPRATVMAIMRIKLLRKSIKVTSTSVSGIVCASAVEKACISCFHVFLTIAMDCGVQFFSLVRILNMTPINVLEVGCLCPPPTLHRHPLWIIVVVPVGAWVTPSPRLDTVHLEVEFVYHEPEFYR
jgi:hypothetical protein